MISLYKVTHDGLHEVHELNNTKVVIFSLKLKKNKLNGFLRQRPFSLDIQLTETTDSWRYEFR